ncbi:hypothetical protein SISNIDRAFT_516136 [Sistotremastrum niveocremeum HHB9708]|uniref:Uncharacterized protein n=1 Tax=Sistotremastrum niveocremeum HHB9708 TaxID=1314777 RepID=A0A164SKL2_9AGAM|nr:hypothetical protein SISNIDRAFT_516136 [Sistotremastrum niveocremeum HHB9708]
MAAFESIITAYKFDLKRSIAGQLQDLADKHHVKLEWKITQVTGSNPPIWQAYPAVNDKPWSSYVQAAGTQAEAKLRSSLEVYRMLRGPWLPSLDDRVLRIDYVSIYLLVSAERA